MSILYCDRLYSELLELGQEIFVSEKDSAKYKKHLSLFSQASSTFKKLKENRYNGLIKNIKIDLIHSLDYELKKNIDKYFDSTLVNYNLT